ncbi:MAG TPA: hypothetical protein VEV82_11465 [Actinomycetota bacterium]|nr:hypothetical protein [Actinomycetota bacterium]
MPSIFRAAPAAALGLALTFGLISCTDSDQSPSVDVSPSSGNGTSIASDASPSPLEPVGLSELPQGNDPVDLDPADFTTKIDNPYFPLVPGTRSTFRETDEEGNRLKVVVIVTKETKKIADGITARVVRDTVSEDGEIVEDTFDWYAQDSEGNVWYMGENTAEFKNGKITTKSGSFEAGVDGALPGIVMPADPQPGLAYRQEYYKGEAEDNGEVLSTNEMADVAFGHFESVLLTKDTITIEPDVLEYKLYAKDVGLVLALGISGGGGREELVEIDKVPPTAGTGPLGTSNP